MQGEYTFTAKNGKPVILREAIPEDARGLIETVRSEADERSYILTEVRGGNETEVYKYLAALDRKRNLFLVAVCDGRVIGGLAALQADGGQRAGTVHICNVGLHLHREWRNLGIGSRMLDYAVEWSQDKGYKSLEANIFTTNKRSLGLFNKKGFKEGLCHNQFRIGNSLIEEVCVAYLHSQ